VKVRVGGDNKGLDSALKESQGLISRFARTGTGALSGLGAGFKRMLGGVFSVRGAIATLAGTGGLSLLINSSISSADAIAKMADRTGTGVEELQELTYSARLAGIEQNKFGRILERLTVSIAETVRNTGEAKVGFELAGVTLRDTEGRVKSHGRVLEELADAIAKTESATKRADIVNRIFGQRMGGQLLPLFKNGAAGIRQMREEAREMGLVLDTVMVREAEKAGDQMARLGIILRTNLTRAVLTLTPQIIALGEAAAKWAPRLAAFIDRISPDEVKTSDALRQRILEIEAALRKLSGLSLDNLLKITDFSGFGEQRQEIARLLGELLRLDDLLKERVRKETMITGVIEGTGDANDVLSEKVKSVTEALQFERDQLGRTSREQAIASALRRADTDAATEQGRQIANLAGTLYDLARAKDAETEATKRATEAAVQQERDREAAGERARAIIDERLEMQRSFEQELDQRVHLAEISNLNARDQEIETQLLDEINKHRAAGIPLIQEEIDQRREMIGQSVDRANSLRQETGLVRDLGLSFSSTFEDAVVKGGKLRDLLKGLEQDATRIAARRLITEPLTDAFSGVIDNLGGGGGGGSGGAGLFAGIGSFFASLFHEGGRVGGPAPRRPVPALTFAGAPRLAGGTMPSLRPDEIPAILHRDEEVLTAQQARILRKGGESTRNVTQIFNIQTPDLDGFRLSERQIGRRMRQAL
jgi:hypothetical protein